MIISIGFSTPKKTKISSALIKFWTGKPYSHVFITWKSEKLNRTLVYHASSGSVHFLSIDSFKKNNNILSMYNLNIDNEQYLHLVRKCIDLAGERYGYLELLKIVINDVCALINIDCKMINNRGYICSELLGELLSDLGAKFNRPVFLLRPDHIENAVISLGGILE